MRVYLVRHGESETNLTRRWTGWLDAPLTETGRKQAQALQPLLASVHFDKIVSSDLSRAVDTAKNAIPGCEPERMPVLREIRIGSLEGTPIIKNADDSAYVNTQYGYASFGGESYDEFAIRVSEFIRYVEALQDVNTLAVFSHAGFSRNFLHQVTKANLSTQNMHLFNCCVLIFDYINGNWFLHGLINQN